MHFIIEELNSQGGCSLRCHWIPSGRESSSLEDSYDLLEIAKSHLEPSRVGQAGEPAGAYTLRLKQRKSIK